jgi:hypothetical protein
MVLDHVHDGPLVDAEMIRRHPAVLVLRLTMQRNGPAGSRSLKYTVSTTCASVWAQFRMHTVSWLHISGAGP